MFNKNPKGFHAGCLVDVLMPLTLNGYPLLWPQ